jgi:hypothetical protein
MTEGGGGVRLVQSLEGGVTGMYLWRISDEHPDRRFVHGWASVSWGAFDYDGVKKEAWLQVTACDYGVSFWLPITRETWHHRLRFVETFHTDRTRW